MTDTFRYGAPTCAGSYRMPYARDGARYLEIRRGSNWSRIAKPIPPHIRSAYSAANWLKL